MQFPQPIRRTVDELSITQKTRCDPGCTTQQDPVFEGGNAYLNAKFPLLDYIKRIGFVRR